MKFKDIFKKKLKKKDRSITIKEDGVIPFDEIEDLTDVTFIIITKNETVLEKIIGSIMEFERSHRDMNINVVLSSSYQTLHELSGGAL